MKGIVFTEFLEMVEERFSPDIADQIIEISNLPSGGAYTAVGTYDHEEMLQLVTNLSNETGIAVAALVQTFGRYLFGRFVQGYPHFFEGVDSAFGFVNNIEHHIHVEVLKLYPDAELPTFDCETLGPGRMVMTYRSKRPFADLAQGLLAGCIEHFGDEITIRRENLAEDGTAARFTLTQEG